MEVEESLKLLNLVNVERVKTDAETFLRSDKVGDDEDDVTIDDRGKGIKITHAPIFQF